MTDARSKFEFRRLKVPELKHILKGKRIPYTEKRTEEFVFFFIDLAPDVTSVVSDRLAAYDLIIRIAAPLAFFAMLLWEKSRRRLPVYQKHCRRHREFYCCLCCWCFRRDKL